MTPVITLYCIADEAGFRLLRGKGPEIEDLLTASAETFEDVDHAFSHKGGNRSGRGGFNSFSHETTSAAEIERPRLAKHVLRALEAEWAKGTFDQIVLAAGPKMLGALRDAMPKDLAKAITQEFDKDLSDIPDHALASHLTR